MKKIVSILAISMILTPLCLSADILKAVSENSMDAVKKCLDSGENINRTDEGGFTPLMTAVENGNAAMVKLLLSRKPDLERKNVGGGMTALMRASSGGKAEILDLLLRAGANANAVDVENKTALFFAAKKDVMEMLLKSKAAVNHADSFGNTPLMHLYRQGKDVAPETKELLDMIRLLVQYGADVNVNEKKGQTPLSLAASLGYTGVITLLLEKGGRINGVDDGEMTALMHAVTNGQTGAVKLLVEKGANVNLKDPGGMTALALAAQQGHVEIEKILRAAGAK